VRSADFRKRSRGAIGAEKGKRHHTGTGGANGCKGITGRTGVVEEMSRGGGKGPGMGKDLRRGSFAKVQKATITEDKRETDLPR